VNVIAEGGYDPREAPPPTPGMIIPAFLSLLIGLAPRPFVTGASLAHEATGGVQEASHGHVIGHATDAYDIPPP
jgi:hypothetical protein